MVVPVTFAEDDHRLGTPDPDAHGAGDGQRARDGEVDVLDPAKAAQAAQANRVPPMSNPGRVRIWPIART
jgi:hypothetical protein